ncbi:MAG: hypothetical protein FGM58_04785 [Acidimicrobiia bacterium]|nr:hypothetical protein [Acidimicrobiia bacterium]
MDDGLDRVLTSRVERAPSAPVDLDTVVRWCSVFGASRDAEVDALVPALMYPTFVRPSSPPPADARESGVVLHDELKQALDLPIAIAVGYELELLGQVAPADRLVAVERVASVGEPRASRLGEGRDWVIEVTTSTTTGAPVGVERFHMFGYRTDAAPLTSGAPLRPPAADGRPDWTETLSVDADLIVRAATVNRVWAPAHHRSTAARAAGLPDVILDTSSQVALLAGAARRRRPDAPLRSVELSMRRAILPGVEVVIAGVDDAADTVVVATVDGVVVSRSVVRFAT